MKSERGTIRLLSTGPIHVDGNLPLKVGEPVEVMPVAEHEAVLAGIEALLPRVYDGMHLADCPYVDVLLRVKAALDDVLESAGSGGWAAMSDTNPSPRDTPEAKRGNHDD